MALFLSPARDDDAMKKVAARQLAFARAYQARSIIRDGFRHDANMRAARHEEIDKPAARGISWRAMYRP